MLNIPKNLKDELKTGKLEAQKLKTDIENIKIDLNTEQQNNINLRRSAKRRNDELDNYKKENEAQTLTIQKLELQTKAMPIYISIVGNQITVDNKLYIYDESPEIPFKLLTKHNWSISMM